MPKVRAMTKARAAVLRQIPGKLEIDDVEVDSPGPREVLLRTHTAGLCHSDLHFMEGKYPYPTPVVMGHESAGIVEAVGDQVTYVKPGDHVITCLSVYCGKCEPCLTGHLSLCGNKAATQRPFDQEQRLTADGAPVFQFLDLSCFAELMLVHEHAVVKIRDDMPLDKAALIGCAVTTGVGAVFNTAKVEPGTTVAVIGAAASGSTASRARPSPAPARSSPSTCSRTSSSWPSSSAPPTWSTRRTATRSRRCRRSPAAASTTASRPSA